MTRFFASVFCVALLLFASMAMADSQTGPGSRQRDVTYDEIAVTLTDDGIAHYSGTGTVYDDKSDQVGIREVYIDEGVKAIEQISYPDVETIYIPSSVEKIGETLLPIYFGGREPTNPFALCLSLKRVVVDENNPYFYSLDGVLFSRGMGALLCYPAAREGTEYTIPEGTQMLASCGFYETRYLERIIIPDTVREIRELAIYDCDSLKWIAIPGTVTQLNMHFMSACSSIEKLTLSSGLTRIPEYAFEASQMKEISIAATITEIGEGAFEYVKGLKLVDIPGSVKTIGAAAFDLCSDLTTVYLAEGTETIADYVFSSTSLHRIFLPKSIRSIGERNFDNKPEGFKAGVYRGSYAHEYCKENDIPFFFQD